MHDKKLLINAFKSLEKVIDYKFKNMDYLLLALTHSSYANENRRDGFDSNERLEYLGDAVLNMVVSEIIYTSYPGLTEGEMTKARSIIVCEPTLAKCACNIGLGQYLLLGKGEELTGGRMRPSVLSDAFEALIGAVYLDGGLEKVRTLILKQLGETIMHSINGMITLDFKTELQEMVQGKGERSILYEIIDETGPDHNKIFVAQVSIDGIVAGTGKGKTKKEAEQNAAKAALHLEQPVFKNARND